MLVSFFLPFFVVRSKIKFRLCRVVKIGAVQATAGLFVLSTFDRPRKTPDSIQTLVVIQIKPENVSMPWNKKNKFTPLNIKGSQLKRLIKRVQKRGAKE